MSEADYLRRSPVQFDEPNYQVCYAYWQRLKGSRRSPTWREWDWLEIPSKLIPYFIIVDVIIVDVLYDPLTFRYRFWGTASVAMHNKDFTGLTTGDIRSSITRDITERQYRDVVEHHEAIGSKYIIQTREGGVSHIQTSPRMPFSNDGERVTQIVNYVDWSRDLASIREEHIQAFGDARS